MTSSQVAAMNALLPLPEEPDLLLTILQTVDPDTIQVEELSYSRDDGRPLHSFLEFEWIRVTTSPKILRTAFGPVTPPGIARRLVAVYGGTVRMVATAGFNATRCECSWRRGVRAGCIQSYACWSPPPLPTGSRTRWAITRALRE